MQINVLEYSEQGALARCPQKVAIVDRDRRLSSHPWPNSWLLATYGALYKGLNERLG